MFIGKKYKIESDENNIILSSRLVKREGDHIGEEYWSPEGYFANLKEAIKFMADLELKKTELSDLLTIIAKQDEIYALIGGLNV